MPAEFPPLAEALAAWVRPVGLTLLHALWQGFAIGAVAWLALRTLRDAAPQARYATACAALAACVLWPALTLWRLAATATAPAAATENAARAIPAPAQAPPGIDAFAGGGAIDAALPWLVALWACGAALMLLRMAAGLRWVAGLRRRAHRVEAGHWAERMRALSRRFGLDGVTLAVLADDGDGHGGPLAAGLWRPMVFVPASLLAKLPPELLEALLAHELAHIRRHDYLANLLQRAAEALLFFHPVVWWLSRRIRQERELVADDLAASVLGEPKRLALALAELDHVLSLPTLAQAAHGGHLMSRIRSLLHPRQRPASPPLAALLAIPLGALALACAGVIAHAQTGRPAKTAPAPGTDDAARETIALVRHDSEGMTVSGRSDDFDAIRGARAGIDGDFIWLRRDGRPMVVRDPATVARIRALWTEEGPAQAQMKALSARMDAQSVKVNEIGRRINATVPGTIGNPDMQRAVTRLGELAAQQATLAAEQAKLATGQAARAVAGREDATAEAIEARRMAELEQRMGRLGTEMEALGETIQAEAARIERATAPLASLEKEMAAATAPLEATARELESLAGQFEREVAATEQRVRGEIDRAVASGLAQPVGR